MTDQHPITPPPELIAKWAGSMCGYYEAARWGADQELEACCKWLKEQRWEALAIHLRAARRPKPPSLKEQALMALEDGDLGPGASLTPVEVCTIRRALEQLDD
jgi:hypothetical protein